MNDENHRKYRKYWLLALFALFIAIMGVVLPEQEDIAFEIVKNNTDLCDFNHTSMACNGTRQNNVTYYTNNTPIVLYVFAHASASGGVAGVFVYRDDKLIAAQSGRPLASPEQTWREVTAIIPKNSSYRVNFTDFHHFEWYEDQILSGRNGTLSINQSGGAGCTENCSFNNIFINTLLKNNTLDFYGNYIHLSSPFQNFNVKGDVFSNLDISDGFTNINTENITSFNNSNIYKTPELIRLEVSNANNNLFEIRQNESVYIIIGRTYKYNDTHFDMNGANLTNCSNCGGSQNLSQVLDVGNNAGNQSMNYVNNINISKGFNATVYSDGNEGIIMQRNSYNVFRFIEVSNGSTGVSNYFGAFKARGTENNLMPCQKDDLIFSFYGVGYQSSWGAGSPNIRYRCADNYNATSNPTYITFMTTNVTGAEKYIKQDQNGNIIVDALAGTGSNYPVRADSTGTLNVNRTAGAGITMKSPDGNSWCITVSNAGAMAVAAGACP